MQVSGSDPNRIYITWNFTSMCNFSCTYCPEYLHDNSYGFPDYADAVNFVRKISERGDPIFFEILGGETTLWPKLQKFLVEIIKINPRIVVEINTNGSRTRNWWTRFTKCNLQDNVVLNFSYHAAQCDADLFYDNLKIVSEAGYTVCANYMLDPEKFYVSKKLYEKTVVNLDVDTNMRVLRPDFDSEKLIDGYTPEMLKIIEKTNDDTKGKAHDSEWNMDIYYDGERVNWQKKIIDKEHSFQFWRCSAGSRRFFIKMDGEIYPCSELILNPLGRSLGNINNFKILDDLITCPAEYCACKVDALAYKHD